MIKHEEIINFLFGSDAAKEIDSMDKFKEKFSGGDSPAFVAAAALEDSKSPEFKRFMPRAVGQLAGKSTTALKKRMAELEIDLSSDEIKDKPLEDVIDIALTKTVSTVKNKFNDYETRLKATENDAVKQWETKFTALSNKYNDLNTLHSTLKQTHDSDVANHKNELRSFKMKTVQSAHHDKHIKWKSGVRDVEKSGFFANLNSKFKFDFDEENNDIVPLDLEGKRIPNPKQAGTWKTYPQILEEQGIADGVWAQNENARKMNQNFNTFASETAAENNNGGSNGGKKPHVSSRVVIPG